jgi:peptide/nickel transport system substrate-binding protein
MRRAHILSALLAPVLVVALAACGSSGGSSSTDNATSAAASGSATTPQRGGSLTVLESVGKAGAWPSGLDPATSATGGSNHSQLQAIFGGLFLLRSDPDGAHAHVVPNQARSAQFSDDLKTLTIKLRPGMTFSDGTAFNAKAVIWNWKRLNACASCPDWTLRKHNPFTSPDPLTVVVHMTQPNAALLDGFIDSVGNWIASPTAFAKMGAKKFSLEPVGAGPFVVVSDKLNSELVLKRNPKFFKADKGLPYLDSLTFKSIGSDQAAYQALLAGSAGAYEALAAPSLIKQAESNPKLTVTSQPATAPYMTQLNTLAPPFNNKKAREAIYYASNWKAINEGVFDGKQTLVQGFTTPDDLFYHQKTPGYRTYDLAKAKQLVQELGGLHVRLITPTDNLNKEVMTALQTQWQQAGIDVSIKDYQLPGFIQQFNGGKWQAALATAGGWDPSAGLGLGFRFSSTAQFTSVKDPQLDTLIEQSVETGNKSDRAQIYQKIAKYLSDHALASFGFGFAPASLVVKGVHGPGLTTKIPPIARETSIIWSQVWRE